MTVKVVDASVVAAILFAEPEFEEAVAMLKDCDLIVPRLLPYEIANVATTKRRKHPEKAAFIAQALVQFDEMGITLVDTEMRQAYATAAMSGLSGYDASYLLLSRATCAEIATFDRKLKAATRI